MSNIEHLRLLIEGEPDEIRYEFFMLLLDSLKDLHEEQAKLWKAIAELQLGEMQKFHDKVFERNSKTEPVMTKKEFNEYVKKDMEYPYEPTE